MKTKALSILFVLTILQGCGSASGPNSSSSDIANTVNESTQTESSYSSPNDIDTLQLGSDSTEPDDSLISPEPSVAAPIELNGNWIDSVSEVSEKDGVFEIFTPEELAWVAATVNSGQPLFAGKTVKLMENIDLAGKEWTSIGAPPMDAPMSVMMRSTFTGIFDGNYKTIKNLSIGTEDNPDQYGKRIEVGENMFRNGYVGLFGTCGGFGGSAGDTVIKNLGLENVSIHSVANGIGALIGQSWGAYTENCYSTGVIKAYSPEITAGGLIGDMVAWDELSLKNSYSTVNLYNINGDPNMFFTGIGGLIGSTSVGNEPVIVNCYATGRISSAGKNGGLLGGISNNNSSFEQSIVNTFHNKDNDPYFVERVGFFQKPDPNLAVFARSTVELRTQSTFVGWDFANIWAIDASKNNGFPYLSSF